MNITRNRTKLPDGENFATITIKVQNWLKENWKQIQNEGWSRVKVCEKLSKMLGIDYTPGMLRTQLKAWPQKWPRIKKDRLGRQQTRKPKEQVGFNQLDQSMLMQQIMVSIQRDLIIARAVAKLLEYGSFREELDPTVMALDNLIERLQAHEKYTNDRTAR